jgi:hypothetical protein
MPAVFITGGARAERDGRRSADQNQDAGVPRAVRAGQGRHPALLDASAYCLDDAESIRRVFEELIGKPAGDTFTLIPPFCTDYGLNITVGRVVFIGYECAFTGHAAITDRRSRLRGRSRCSGDA